MQHLIASQARKELYRLIDQAAESHEPTIIKGKRNTAVLISGEDWEDIEETLYVAGNKKLSDSLLKGLNTDYDDCLTSLED